MSFVIDLRLYLSDEHQMVFFSLYPDILELKEVVPSLYYAL